LREERKPRVFENMVLRGIFGPRDLGVDGWIIIGLISTRWDVGLWTGLGWPRIGTGGVGL